MTDTNKGGRPPHSPSDDQRKIVKAMAIAGIDQDTIAETVGIARETLRKHYDYELTFSKAVANAKVVANLFRQATKDSPSAIPAAIYWCRTQLGWDAREPTAGKKEQAAATAEQRVATGRFAVPPPPPKATN